MKKKMTGVFCVLFTIALFFCMSVQADGEEEVRGSKPQPAEVEAVANALTIEGFKKRNLETTHGTVIDEYNIIDLGNVWAKIQSAYRGIEIDEIGYNTGLNKVVLGEGFYSIKVKCQYIDETGTEQTKYLHTTPIANDKSSDPEHASESYLELKITDMNFPTSR